MGPTLVYSHAFFFSLFILTTTFVVTNAASYTTAPAPAPHHHHHNGGHHRRHPQSQPPTPPPAHPPTTSYPSKSPTPPPAKSPSPPPAKPPTTAPPAKPPTQPSAKAPTPAYPRKLVAVQGVVYCKNCTYAGVDTLYGAKPLQGATVEVRCRNTMKYQIKGVAKSDKNGYFFLKMPRTVTTFGVRNCRAVILRTPKHGGACGKPTNLNGGALGGLLIPDKHQFQSNNQSKPVLPDFLVYNVGPFAYEPIICPKH